MSAFSSGLTLANKDNGLISLMSLMSLYDHITKSNDQKHNEFRLIDELNKQ